MERKPIEGKEKVSLEKSLENIMNNENVKIFVESAKKYGSMIKLFLGKKTNEMGVIITIAIIVLIGLGFSIMEIINQNQTLNKGTNTLEQIDKYNIDRLKENISLKNKITTLTEINNLLDINENIKNEKKRYEDHKTELQSSYSNFLKYLLVPKLNIRKETYTDKINIDLLGKRFLEKNPYNDINLYEKWSNFFSSTDKNQINSIENLEISEIEEGEYGLYKIKLSFNFMTPTKNALLFLVDKISTTSDKENISLLGEFVYNLRQQIKDNKQNEIDLLKKDIGNQAIAGDENKIIGKELYRRMTSKEKGSKLIDEKIINNTITNIMECNKETDAECFYKFREKYRNIAGLAYTVGSSTNTNKTDDLKIFLNTMAPLMTVQNFQFEKIKNNEILDKSTKYQGNLELEIYGENISKEEITEIALELGKKCFSTNEELTPDEAILKITKQELENAKDTNNNYGEKARIADFKKILENINTNYETLNNYKKTIKLFEVYRMLNEGGFCTTI